MTTEQVAARASIGRVEDWLKNIPDVAYDDVSHLTLGATRPGGTPRPGQFHWTPCTRLMVAGTDIIPTYEGERAVPVPHVYFKSTLGQSPVCPECEGDKEELPPAYHFRTSVCELPLCRVELPTHVVIYADFPANAITGAEAAEILMAENSGVTAELVVDTVVIADVFVETGNFRRTIEDDYPFTPRPKYRPRTMADHMEELTERAAIMQEGCGITEKAAWSRAAQYVGEFSPW